MKDYFNEQAYTDAVQEFSEWEIKMLPDNALFYLIEKYWIELLSNASVMDIQTKRIKYKNKKKEPWKVIF